MQLGIFGWADPVSGQVSNVRTAGFLLGFVLPVLGMWQWQRVNPTRGANGPALILRAGIEVVLAAVGDFLTVFPFGAQAGKQVYTDPATGLAYSGAGSGLVPTPWTVMDSACHCNAKVRISSFSKPVS